MPRTTVITLAGLSPGIEGLRWESDTILRIGRQSSMEVTLDHPSVNRRHAEVVVRGQGGAVRDLGTTNGTFLNGVPVGLTYQKLRHDDLLQCGELTLRVALVPGTAGLLAPQEGQAPARGEAGPAGFKVSGRHFVVEASAQLSGEPTGEEPPFVSDRQPHKGEHLLGLLRMGHYLAHLNSLDQLLHSILDDTVAVLDAQRGCIVLADEATGQLGLHAISFSRQPHSCSKIFSQTLARHCFEHSKSLLCRDVHIDRDLRTSTSIWHGSMASILCAIIRSPRQRLGVLHLDRGPFQDPFTQEDFHLAVAIATSISQGIENTQLAEGQSELLLHTVRALAQAVDMRDPYTGNHTERVTQYALMLAHELGLSAGERNQIQIGAPLHDIGKIAIDDAILRKPAPLTPAEYEVMKSHVVRGAAILEPIPGLQPMVPIVRNHHERWDGTGYPDRLAGEQIPLLARIVAVADAFDAMTSDRPYRPAMPLAGALAQLARNAGSHFDPRCVQAFLRLEPRLATILKRPAAPPGPRLES
jgi:putative nucleotidyltransferase with HDIG domain